MDLNMKIKWKAVEAIDKIILIKKIHLKMKIRCTAFEEIYFWSKMIHLHVSYFYELIKIHYKTKDFYNENKKFLSSIINENK